MRSSPCWPIPGSSGYLRPALIWNARSNPAVVLTVSARLLCNVCQRRPEPAAGPGRDLCCPSSDKRRTGQTARGHIPLPHSTQLQRGSYSAGRFDGDQSTWRDLLRKYQRRISRCTHNHPLCKLAHIGYLSESAAIASRRSDDPFARGFAALRWRRGRRAPPALGARPNRPAHNLTRRGAPEGGADGLPRCSLSRGFQAA
jgi:hypothetical protein